MLEANEHISVIFCRWIFLFVIATLGTSLVFEAVSLVYQPAEISSVGIVCIAMPPQWSNGEAMTPVEYEVVKQWVLAQRKRRHPTWGRDVAMRRSDFHTEGRKTLPLFGVSVDLNEEEDVYMDAEQKQLPFSQQLPHLAGQKVALNLCGRTKVRRDPRRNWSNLDPRENRMNIPG